MSLRTLLARRFRSLRGRTAAERDLADEVEHYVAEATAAYREQGLSHAEARRAARVDMGSRTSVQQQVRDTRWETRIESWLTDLRRAVRRLFRSPAFAAVTVVTLALGIGASTAMFSVVRPVLLQALPYPDGDRIVVIRDASGPAGIDVTFGTFQEVLARSRSLQWMAVTRTWQPTLVGFGEAERLDGQSVSANYFRVLGVRPALGRDFSEEDDIPGAPPVAIVTDGLWRRRFGADPDLIGRTIMLDGIAVTVIAVMPRTFENAWSAEARIWRPLGYDRSLPIDGREWGHNLQSIARLARDSSLDAARQELGSIARAPVPQFTRPAWASLSSGFMVTPLQDYVAAYARPALTAVAAGTLLLLLMAAVNVANLTLARGAERRIELATCAAFGASRMQMFRPLLAEGLLLAAVGGVLGVALAYTLVGALVAFDGFALPRAEAIYVDRAALAFAAALAAFVGVMAGCVPGLFLASRVVPGGGSHVIAAHQRLRRGFVAAEIALAMVLLVGAGLLVRTVQQLLAVTSGLRPEGVLTVQVQTSGLQFRDPSRVRQFFDQVRTAVQAVPGVGMVAVTSQMPLSGDADLYGLRTRGDSLLPPGADPSAYRYAVSPGYIEAMGIPLQRGRTIEERDQTSGQPVAVVSASVARRRFPAVDPIGERIRLGPNWLTVIGVAGDVTQSSLAAAAAEAVYVPEAQWHFADRVMWVVVRSTVDPATLEPSVRQAIRSVDPDQPILRVATMEQRMAASIGRQRFVMTAFNTFAIVSLLLAAIGVYGVLASGVIDRMREIALRSAVGASQARIIGLVGGQALGSAAIGMVIGVGGAIALSGGLSSMLFEVSPLDGLTYAGVAVLLFIATTVSAIAPIRRALRIAPGLVLRSY